MKNIGVYMKNENVQEMFMKGVQVQDIDNGMGQQN